MYNKSTTFFVLSSVNSLHVLISVIDASIFNPGSCALNSFSIILFQLFITSIAVFSSLGLTAIIASASLGIALFLDPPFKLQD